MSAVVRWLIGLGCFVVIMLVGRVLGIHPSLAESVLVAVALGFSEGVREALS